MFFFFFFFFAFQLLHDPDDGMSGSSQKLKGWWPLQLIWNFLKNGRPSGFGGQPQPGTTKASLVQAEP